MLYPTNGERVLAVNRHRARRAPYFRIPFSGPEAVEPVLGMARLYQTARELDIPIPRIWDLAREDPAAVAAMLPYLCIAKPTEQHSFCEARDGEHNLDGE